MIPAINTKAKFTFLAPFDQLVKNQEYTVISIRTIPDLNSNGIDVFKTVYEIVGLDELTYDNDVINNIPIVTFISDSNILLNIPSNKILGVATNEFKYQEKILTVNLPALPIDYDLTSLKDNIKVLVKEQIGFDINVEEVSISAVSLVNELDHNTFMNIINANGLDKRSYLTKYLEMVELYNSRETVIKGFEEFLMKIKNSGVLESQS